MDRMKKNKVKRDFRLIGCTEIEKTDRSKYNLMNFSMKTSIFAVFFATFLLKMCYFSIKRT